MSVSLHKILDRVKAGQFLEWDFVHSQDSSDAVAELRTRGGAAVCFDIGDAVDLDVLDPIPDLVRPPYATSWFEWQLGIERWGALMFEGAPTDPRSDRAYILFLWCGVPQRADGDLGFVGISSFEILKPEFIATNHDFLLRLTDGSGLKELEAKSATAVLMRFLSALHCKNVTRIEHKPDPARQKRRAKQGRAPLFSYWTLHLDMTPGSRERADHGGTHASPRLHLRRGHPRQFKPGEWTWVQPAVVGSKHGIVHKDYAVKGPR